MAIRLVTYERSESIPDLPGNNVFHSVELFRILEQTPQHSPVMLVAYDGDKPVGKLLCIIRQLSWLTGMRRKCTAYGIGEYFLSSDKSESNAGSGKTISCKPEDIFGEFLNYFTNRYMENLFLIEFRNIEESLFGYKYFRRNEYFPIKWLRVVNSIHHDTIDKWMSTSRKKQIQTGLKNGARHGIAVKDSEVRAFVSMLKNYYTSKVYRYFPDFKFFLLLQKERIRNKEIGKIFTVSYKNKIIGGSVCIFSGDTAYMMFSGGMRKSYPVLYPGVIAVWTAMEYSRKHGYRHFEFIDAGLPFKKYGYRDFILRFGGKQLSTRRWYRVRWKWLNKLLIRFYV